MTSQQQPDTPGAALQVLNAMPDAVLLVGRDLEIRNVNVRATEILGRTQASLVDETVDLLVAEHHRNLLVEVVQYVIDHSIQSMQPSPAELAFLRNNDTSFTGDVNVSAITIDGRPGALISVRDVTRQKRMESELRTSQFLLAEAQRVAQLGSWQWDLSADTITWSRELYHLFGVEPGGGSIRYAEFLDLIHPADRDRVNTVIQDAVVNRTNFEVEHRIVRPDGVVRLIYGQGAATIDDSGAMVNLIGTAQDITERKANEAQAFQLALEQAARQEAERTKERFQFLAEVSEALSSSLEYEATMGKLLRLIIPRQADWCSINTIDSSGKIDRVAVAHRNPEKQQVLEAIRSQDYLPHGDHSHPLTRAFQDVRPQLHASITDEMLQRMARSSEHLELSRKLNPTSVMLVPLIARGRAFGVLTFGMSDSGRRYSEDDLQLAVEVAHRAAVSIDNAHLYLDAQEAARAREEFVSLVSHELKTPLTVIKGYIQVLERYLNRPEWERERIQTTRHRLSTQVERLELLVADILDVSRMQRGRLDLKVVPGTDLVELARQVMERFDDAIERRPDHVLRVHDEGPVTGCWDPLRLDQVFSNLLSNALKYSPDGGPIDVFIGQDDDFAFVKIRDNGVGISEEEQKSLFQPFQRGAAATRGISGTGLGLYITKQIVEQHGGLITVQSTPGESTTFRLQLPRSPQIYEESTLDPAK